MVARDVQSQQSLQTRPLSHCTGAGMGNLHGCHFPIHLLDAKMQHDDRGSLLATVYSLLGIQSLEIKNVNF